MMKPQISHERAVFHFGNPFRAISQKAKVSPSRSRLSPGILSILNLFEESLAERMKILMPTNEEDVGSFDWLKSAMESLCAVHGDIEKLITVLDLPLTTWDEKWIEVYLDTSMTLLDLCNAFTSEISKLHRGNLFVRCAVSNLENDGSRQVIQARSLFSRWKQNMAAKNERMDKCSTHLHNIVKSLHLPKVKTSSKGKALMSGMYGVRVLTVFLCGVVATILSGASTNMVELQISDAFPWADAYRDLESCVNGGLKKLQGRRKGSLLEEVNSVDHAVDKMRWTAENGEAEAEAEAAVTELRGGVERLSEVLRILEEEVDGFFKMVMGGRDALLSSLRSSASLAVDKSVWQYLEQQAVM